MNKLFSYLFTICCITILFSCNKEYSVETNLQARAEGSLWDSTGSCLKDSVHGTFYNGVLAGSDTAYVEVQVNVTQTGVYSIASDMQNGFRFYDSGFFSTTGINTIHLKQQGTAILPASTTFAISFDSTTCGFTVNVQDSTGTGLGGQDTTGTGSTDSTFGSGNWQFSTDAGGTFNGTFSYVVSAPDTIHGSGTLLGMSGYTASGDTALVLAIVFPGNTIEPGTYSTQIVGSGTYSTAAFAFAETTSGNTIYEASQDASSAANLTITVANYNSGTYVITGTFSGTALDDTSSDPDATIQIQNGSFTATVYH